MGGKLTILLDIPDDSHVSPEPHSVIDILSTWYHIDMTWDDDPALLRSS